MRNVFRLAKAQCSSWRGRCRKRQYHVYTQGQGLLGCLGHADFADKPEATLVGALQNENIVSAAAGWGHSACLTDCGKLVLWGRPVDLKNVLRMQNIEKMWPFAAQVINRLGLLADKYIIPQPVVMDVGAAPIEAYAGKPVGMPPVEEIPEGVLKVLTKVRCGAAVTAVVSECGQLFMFGQNRFGQCGVGEADHIYLAVRSGGPELWDQRVVDVALGFQHTVALTDDGQVFAWGKGMAGQCGNGRTLDFNPPGRVELPAGVKALAISSGQNHSAAVCDDGLVYRWGRMQSSLLKEKKKIGKTLSHQDLLLPEPFSVGTESPATEVVCSSHCTVIRTQDDLLWMAGLAKDGHPKVMHTEPLEVTGAAGFGWSSARLVDTVFTDPLLLRSDGSLLKLTLGSNDVTVAPHVVPGVTSAGEGGDRPVLTDVAVGFRHQILLTRPSRLAFGQQHAAIAIGKAGNPEGRRPPPPPLLIDP